MKRSRLTRGVSEIAGGYWVRLDCEFLTCGFTTSPLPPPTLQNTTITTSHRVCVYVCLFVLVELKMVSTNSSANAINRAMHATS